MGEGWEEQLDGLASPQQRKPRLSEVKRFVHGKASSLTSLLTPSSMSFPAGTAGKVEDKPKGRGEWYRKGDSNKKVSPKGKHFTLVTF